MEVIEDLRVRVYGGATIGGPQNATVVVLHGGPGAVGGAAGLAAGLADPLRVLEPWQRGSGPEPLTIARHVEDLHALIAACCAEQPPTIVGESWGAMLTLAHAAAWPNDARALVLVSCGTFDVAARAIRAATLRARTSDSRPYDYAPVEPPYEANLPEPFDSVAFTQTWDDMLRLQGNGTYPQAFAAIRIPVLMIHGDHDPHPGAMIRDSLKPYLPQLEYRELQKCGHSPWIERFARDAFFSEVRGWIASLR